VARPAKGTIETHVLEGGTRSFHLRFRVSGQREREILHERPGCACGCGGGWDEQSARNELGNILARVRVGVWRPRTRVPPPTESRRAQPTPTFHEYASRWLQAKVDGAVGDRPIDANTEADYRWRLLNHLLPFFASYPLDAIDRDLCVEFKTRKLREAAELREAIDAGAQLRDGRGRRVRPLSIASVRKLLDTLAAVLDDAMEDEYIDRNPARSKRLRLRVPKPRRTFLEMDELAALIDAADAQDGPLASRPARVASPSSMRDRVAAAAAAGRRPKQIASELGIAKSTVSYHLARVKAPPSAPYAGRRAVVEILGRSGLRVSEVCDLRVGHLRLHDPNGARLHIPDAKTEAGIREVQLTPDMVETLIEHLDRLRRLGHSTGRHDFVVQNLRGGRLSRQRAGEIVGEAAAHASARLEREGMPALPRTTPHSLRRTYISIALLANHFDVKWVMSQVGHADSKMTMDVYAQLEQRAARSHGTSFDRLVRQAREQLIAAAAGSGLDPVWATNGPRATELAPSDSSKGNGGDEDNADFQYIPPMARPGLEPGTPRFSGTRQSRCLCEKSLQISVSAVVRCRPYPCRYGECPGGLGPHGAVEVLFAQGRRRSSGRPLARRTLTRADDRPAPWRAWCRRR